MKTEMETGLEVSALASDAWYVGVLLGATDDESIATIHRAPKSMNFLDTADVRTLQKTKSWWTRHQRQADEVIWPQFGIVRDRKIHRARSMASRVHQQSCENSLMNGSGPSHDLYTSTASSRHAHRRTVAAPWRTGRGGEDSLHRSFRTRRPHVASPVKVHPIAALKPNILSGRASRSRISQTCRSWHRFVPTVRWAAFSDGSIQKFEDLEPTTIVAFPGFQGENFRRISTS